MKNKTTYVIGHKTPDSDSVCSAIGLARLRGFIPACAGRINDETRFVLEYFGEEEPVILEDLTGLDVVLVDHNEKSHAQAGFENADISEIVDHHFIVPERTISAPCVRQEMLGSTAAIVYKLYEEAGVVLDRKTAGLLLGAVISDTLFFKSPACTDDDKKAAEDLARIAGVDKAGFAEKMFEAGSDLKGKSIREIFYGDYKRFTNGSRYFGCGALTAAGAGNLADLEKELLSFMAAEEKTLEKEEFVIFMLTNLISETTAIICAGDKAKETIKAAFADRENCTWDGRILRVGEILSRKLQLVPQVFLALS